MLVFPLTSKVYDEDELLPMPVAPVRVLAPLSVEDPLNVVDPFTDKVERVPTDAIPGAEVMALPSAEPVKTCVPPT